MTVKQLTSDQALALESTTDPDTGLQFPALLSAQWGAAVLAALQMLIDASLPDLRVVEIENNADAIGVLPGKAIIEGTLLDYAGDTDAGGAIDGLTDNDTTYIWAENNSGSLAINSAVDGTGWPSSDHIKLAKVTLSGGAIDSIEDMRAATVLEKIGAATTSVRGTVKQAAVDADVTDNTGGTADGTLAAVSGSGADSAINDNFAELAAELNDLRAKLRTAEVLDT